MLLIKLKSTSVSRPLFLNSTVFFFLQVLLLSNRQTDGRKDGRIKNFKLDGFTSLLSLACAPYGARGSSAITVQSCALSVVVGRSVYAYSASASKIQGSYKVFLIRFELFFFFFFFFFFFISTHISLDTILRWFLL